MKVKVLMKEDIEGLGKLGDVLEVAPGHARNYLLPRGLAVEVTPGTVHAINKAQKERARREAETKVEFQELAERMRGAEVTVQERVSKTGTLYGSVSPAAIVEALAGKLFTINERMLRIEQPIKALGEFEVIVHLHPEIEDVPVKVTVEAAEGVAPEEDDDEEGEGLFRARPIEEMLAEEEARAEAKKRDRKDRRAEAVDFSEESGEAGEAEAAPEADSATPEEDAEDESAS